MLSYSHEVLYALVSAPDAGLVKVMLLQQPESSCHKFKVNKGNENKWHNTSAELMLVTLFNCKFHF